MHLAIRFLAGSARQQTAAQGELAHDSRRAVRTARADAVPGVRVLELCCTDGDKAQSQDTRPVQLHQHGVFSSQPVSMSEAELDRHLRVEKGRAPIEEAHDGVQ